MPVLDAPIALTILPLLVDPFSKRLAIARLTFMVRPELLHALNVLELTPTLPLALLLPLVPCWLRLFCQQWCVLLRLVLMCRMV